MAKTPYSSPLLSHIAQALRVRHYSIRTEKSYIDWIKRFIYFHHKRHPKEMGGAEVAAFLTHLAVDRNVAAATQNQALNALVFLYKVVLERPLQQHIQGIVRAKKPKRLPVVLTKGEVAKLLSNLDGVYWLLGCLQYGSGLRLIESMRLRVMDLDYDRQALFVRSGKGDQDRVVTLAEDLIVPLQRHLEGVRTVFERDVAAGFGRVYLPHALDRKYPNAGREWK